MKEKFTEKYSKLIEAGRLELVSAPLDYYPQYIFEHGKGTGQLGVINYDHPITINRPGIVLGLHMTNKRIEKYVQ